MDKLERERARAARQAEIEAMTASMMSSTPIVTKHPVLHGLESKGRSSISTGEFGLDDDIIVVREEESEEEENEGGDDVGQGNERVEPPAVTGVVLPPSTATKYSGGGISDTVDDFATEHQIPISHQVELSGHTKAVSCISFEPAGNRVVTGSMDYGLKIYDFGGMDQRHMAFRSIEVEDGHPVLSVSHSPSGDRVIVGTGSCQPKIYDREGSEQMKFVRGDMYLRDLTHTKGHTMEVTSVAWHPKEKNFVLSCGLDGTIRIWDLLGECLFKNLVNKHVLRIVSKNGQVRIGATCCCYTPDGNKIIGGAADGSIHIWSVRKQYSRPDLVIRPACYTINTKVRGVQEIADSIKGYAVTSITVSSDSRLLVSRNEDGIIRLWDLRRSQSQIETPLMEITGMHNIYPMANVDFSPDNTWLACGTSLDRNNPEQRSTLSLFQIPSIPAFSPGTPIPQPMQPTKKLVIGISGAKTDISAICVKWQPNTNQIFCTTSSGCTKVFFDPRFSKKGALLTAGRAPPRPKDPVDEVIGTIYNPNSLPMFRNTEGMFGPKRGREYEKRLEAQKAKVPERPAKSGPGSKDNMSFFFTQHVMSGRAVDQSRGENPREALLKYDSMAKSDPIFFNKAYVDTQPAQILHSQTAEEEREDFKKKQRKTLDV